VTRPLTTRPRKSAPLGRDLARHVSQRSGQERGPETNGEVVPQLRQAHPAPMGRRDTSLRRRSNRYRGLAKDHSAWYGSPPPEFLSFAFPVGQTLEVRRHEPRYVSPHIPETKQDPACAAAGRGSGSRGRTWRALQDNGASLLLSWAEGLRTARSAMGRLRLASADSTGSAQRGAGRSGMPPKPRLHKSLCHSAQNWSSARCV